MTVRVAKVREDPEAPADSRPARLIRLGHFQLELSNELEVGHQSGIRVMVAVCTAGLKLHFPLGGASPGRADMPQASSMSDTRSMLQAAPHLQRHGFGGLLSALPRWLKLLDPPRQSLSHDFELTKFEPRFLFKVT
jgi:hypothetical protein